AELRGSLAPEKLVISIIAGATTQTLRQGLDHAALVRVMPNTPAQIGEGVNIWYATPEATEAHRGQARALLGALGHELQVADERFVAIATACGRCWPMLSGPPIVARCRCRTASVPERIRSRCRRIPTADASNRRSVPGRVVRLLRV